MYTRYTISTKLLEEQAARVNRLLKNIQLKLISEYHSWAAEAYRDGVYTHRVTGYLKKRQMSDFLCYVETILALDRKENK